MKYKNIFGSGLAFFIGITLILISLVYLIPSGTVSAQGAVAVDESDIIKAQRDIYYCSDRYDLAAEYPEAAVVKIREYCNNSNAAELVEVCSGGELDINKYFGDTNFSIDLCNQAAGYNDEGINVQGGNTESANIALDIYKEAAGCYDYDTISATSIPRAEICSYDLRDISEICESGQILEPRFANSIDICNSLSIDVPLDIEEQINTAIDGAEDGEPGNQSCEDNDGEFVFFQCAIIKGASEAVNELDGRVRSALEVKPEYYENDGLKAAWANFRNIAYLILIPVLLVMVIGTAMGVGFLDAYTIKRALPRLLVAIIFIALSYEICVLLIEIVDVIGKGTAGLIAAPFGGTDELTLTNIFNPSALSGATALGVGVIGGIALVGIGAVSLGIIASYLLVAALALIIIFALLVMREVIIVFLVILAPLAIISWIFPGNDKLWKIWWSSFSKLLLLYPIIVGALVTGRAFALIISDLNATGIEAVFLSFAKLVAYIGPFFLIPTVFRYAGGAFANLAGIVNNRSKGVFDRQRKYRGDSRKKNIAEWKAGERGPAINKRIGEGFGAFAEAKNKRRFLTNRVDREEAMAQQRKLNEMRYGKDERTQATQENDYQLQAQTYASAAEARKYMGLDFGHDAATVERAIAAANATGGFSAQRQNFAARQLVRTGTGYENQDQMQATVARVARSDSEAADLLGEMNATTKGANRHDLAAGFSNQVGAQTNLRARIAAAGGYDAYRRQQIAAAGGEANYQARAASGQANFLQNAEMTELHAQALADIDGVTAVRQKPKALKNMSIAGRETFEAAQASGDTQQAAAWAGHIEKIEQAGTYASMNAAEVAGTEIITPTSGKVVDPSTGEFRYETRVEAGPNVDASGNPINISVPTRGRAAVKVESSPTRLTVNPVTDTIEPVYETEVRTVTDPSTGTTTTQTVTKSDPQSGGKGVKAANPDHDTQTEEIYKRHNTSQPHDPNGPYA